VVATPVHGGFRAAQFGPTSLGYISQTLATTAGVSYTLDFWLSHPFTDTGTEWQVSVGGTTLTDVVNAGISYYTEYTFTFTATSSATVLQFGFMATTASYFYLDDVSVTVASTNPHVVSTSPGGGILTPPFQTVRVAFDRPMNATTVTPTQITLTGPGGSIPVTVAPVSGTGNSQFDVTFVPQTASGGYTLVIGTGVQDQSGHALASPYTAHFTIPGPNVVTNGDFETGDFSGWTQSGDLSYTNVITGTAGSSTIHGGTHAAEFGPSMGLGYIAQTLATTVGVTYTLDFWLSHSSGAAPTEWLVRVGGNTVLDVHDSAGFSYTEFTFTFTATSSATALQFGFYEPPAYFYLDDIRVFAS
jgi:hypothetical protein